jgi:ABC-type antimicrobial peptide transport system permease subunit
MKNVEFITIFVSSNMMAIVAFLAILCTQLIYSLMLSDVEEKTYEFGMLRALGFNTKNVGVTIVMQAVSFALPGLILGFISATVLNIIVRYVLYSITTNYDTYELSYGSVWIGVILGTFIPLMSNIIPIQKALGKNLRSSLDLYHRKAGELTIAI